VYALGVVLYEMLAGHAPFTGDSPVAVAAAHASQPLPRIAEVAPGVPDSIAAACERALAKDPAERPASASAFRRMLERGLAQTSGGATVPIAGDRAKRDETVVLPPSDATAPLPPAAPARSRIAWVLAALLVGVLILAFFLSRVFGSDLSSPKALKVTIPAVTGLQLAEARRLLREKGFTVVVKRVDGRTGEVIRTSPAQGKAVVAGSTVTLFVGSSPVTTEPGGKGKGKEKGKGHGGGNGEGGD
jgi:serine/threonine-protein kinase